MSQAPKPTSGMSRNLIYIMIPVGFVVLVLVLILSGAWVRKETEEPPTVVEEPLEVPE